LQRNRHLSCQAVTLFSSFPLPFSSFQSFTPSICGSPVLGEGISSAVTTRMEVDEPIPPPKSPEPCVVQVYRAVTLSVPSTPSIPPENCLQSTSSYETPPVGWTRPLQVIYNHKVNLIARYLAGKHVITIFFFRRKKKKKKKKKLKSRLFPILSPAFPLSVVASSQHSSHRLNGRDMALGHSNSLIK
jgi:hypothetical protein